MSTWVRFRAASARWMSHPWLVPVAGALYVIVQLGLALRAPETARYFDERDYLELASSLRAGEGFSLRGGPSAFRPPAQPLFVAGVQAAFGTSMSALAGAQAMLVALAALFTARFARPVLGRPDLANLAALGLLAHPGLAYSVGTAYPVALTTAALTIGLLLGARALERWSWASSIGASVGLGIAALATPYFVLTVPALAVGVALRRHFSAAVIVLAVGLAPTVAWMARNHTVVGEATVGTHGGYNLALGADDRATPRSGNTFEPLPPRESLPDDELSRDRARRASALRWIQANPAKWAGLAAARAVATLDSSGQPATAHSPRGLVVTLVGALLSVVVVLGLVGLWLERRRPLALLTAVAFGCVALGAAMAIVKPRFRFPVDPLLGAFAVAAVVRLRESSAPRDRSRLTGEREARVIG